MVQSERCNIGIAIALFIGVDWFVAPGAIIISPPLIGPVVHSEFPISTPVVPIVFSIPATIAMIITLQPVAPPSWRARVKLSRPRVFLVLITRSLAQMEHFTHANYVLVPRQLEMLRQTFAGAASPVPPVGAEAVRLCGVRASSRQHRGPACRADGDLHVRT